MLQFMVLATLASGMLVKRPSSIVTVENQRERPTIPRALSQRAQQWNKEINPLSHGMHMAGQDRYDRETNPDGCINCGTAQSYHAAQALMDRIEDFQKGYSLQTADLSYGDFLGTPQFRQAFADMWSELMVCDIQADEISIHNGCGPLIESVFSALVNPGEYVMIPTPYYPGFDMFLKRRAGIDIFPLELDSESDYALTREKLESAFQQAEQEGKTIRAALITNPTNPLGTVYSDETLKALIATCNEHNVHLVMDEIYALSTFDPEVEFRSIYFFQLPDPSKVHIVYGLSKDWYGPNFRVGIFVTKNQELRNSLKCQSCFTSVPVLMQHIWTDIFSDRKFVKEFVQTNTGMLREAYLHAVNRIQEYNVRLLAHDSSAQPIRYLKSQSGFFIWVDFRGALRYRDDKNEAEKELYMDFLNGKVYIMPGQYLFHDKTPGWFRIVFGYGSGTMNLAFDRIFTVMDKWYKIE